MGLEDNVTLGHALIVQLLWSSDPSCDFDIPEEYHERILQGPWAGDRFCIINLHGLPELKPHVEREWVDVTERVDALLRHLWKEDKGYDWVTDEDEDSSEGEYGEGEGEDQDEESEDQDKKESEDLDEEESKE